jgi:hypothetical protein
MTISYIAAVVFWVLVFWVNQKAWSGVMEEPREEIGAGDLLTAAFFWTGALSTSAILIYFAWDRAPVWFWPIIALGVSGLVLNSCRAALGLPLSNGSQQGESIHTGK